MICEKVLGKLSDEAFSGLKVDYVDIEWHEAFKKLHKKKTQSGAEIGIRLENYILTHGLRQDDVLCVVDGSVVAVNIPACEVIVVDIADHHMVPKVCYEIGNKHASMFYGEGHHQFITPFNEPLFHQLEKLHGVNVEKKMQKLDFDKSLSSSINAHTH